MNNSVTFSILFWTKNKASKDKLPIYARITVNGKRSELSIKRSVDASLWDTKSQKAKGNSQEAKILNRQLNKVESQLYDCYQELKNEDTLITAKAIKARYLGEDINKHSLLELIKFHNVHMKDSIRWGTMKNYLTTEKYINRFLEQQLKTSDIYLSQLSYKFVIDFEIFLRNWVPQDHHKPMSNNTVMKHIQRLRKMINLALKMEWIEKDPFVRFKATYVKKERAFLSEAELASIEAKAFSIERLELVKNLFLFSCYTGLSYSDVVNLKKNDVVKGIDGGNWIFTQRIKTGTAVKIPILAPAWDIIKLYESNPKVVDSDILLPGMSNQKLNSYLKEIADLCGISKNLTFHIARHTFATTVTLCNGVPIETVSKLLGHTKLATTQIYAKVIEQKVAEDMQSLQDKFSSKNIAKTS